MEISQTDSLAAWMNAHSKLNIADEDFHAVPVRLLEAFAKIILRDYGRNEFVDVQRFQTKFGHLVSHEPTHLTKRKLLERIQFLQEELDEFVLGCGFEFSGIDENGDNQDGLYNNGKEQDMGLMADALIDLVYVAKGTAVMMGLPWDELWDDVQRANMAKVRGISHRGNLVDCVKPEGWVPPRTKDILYLAGYQLDKPEIDDEIYLAKPEEVTNVA